MANALNRFGQVAIPQVNAATAQMSQQATGLMNGWSAFRSAHDRAAPQAPAAAPGSHAAGVSALERPAAAAGDFIHYDNEGATRGRPLSDELTRALGFLPELGLSMRVFSGGQGTAEEGGPRTGSTRHDHGNAADVFFYSGDRQLDWRNQSDIPLLQEVVRRGKAAGVTGFGAGPDYMTPGSMHIGFGAPAVWGAGGKSSNAPDWLRSAYYG